MCNDPQSFTHPSFHLYLMSWIVRRDVDCSQRMKIFIHSQQGIQSVTQNSNQLSQQAKIMLFMQTVYSLIFLSSQIIPARLSSLPPFFNALDQPFFLNIKQKKNLIFIFSGSEAWCLQPHPELFFSTNTYVNFASSLLVSMVHPLLCTDSNLGKPRSRESRLSEVPVTAFCVNSVLSTYHITTLRIEIFYIISLRIIVRRTHLNMLADLIKEYWESHGIEVVPKCQRAKEITQRVFKTNFWSPTLVSDSESWLMPKNLHV